MTYSQHNEDDRIDELYKEHHRVFHPFIVDVGAGDGVFLSNSRLMIERYNFGGLMIEPSDEPFKDLEKLYKDNKKVECLHEAMADKKFKYEMKVLADWCSPHWTVAEVVKNKNSKRITRKLSEVIKERKIKKIGIMSIDAEGYDTRILKEFIENCKVRPSLIVIEKKTEADDITQRTILAENYFLLEAIQFNNVFLLKEYK